MGFFRDFKEDMIPEEDAGKLQEATKNAENEEEEKMSDFEDSNVDKDLLNQIFAEDAGEDLDLFGEDTEEPAQEETADFLNPDGESVQQEEEAESVLSAAAGADASSADSADKGVDREGASRGDKVLEDETTVITRGTTINGGISSDGSLEIMGTITGDVECLGKLSVFGHISGNVTARDVVVNTKRLAGNIESEGSVEVVMGTIIIGDITGTSATIAGAVKGNIDVNGPVTVDSTAIVKGSIKAKSIQVNTGAVVDGYCSLNYAGVDLDDFFEEK